jgi:FkbM family methyltransferase
MLEVRPGTQDEKVVEEVLVRNQYGLPDRLSGTVIDIGAHIGAFAVACLERGAARVLCFEPCPGNLGLLKRNTSRFPGRVGVVGMPVWRSDRSEEVGFSGGGRNTARGAVVPWRTGTPTVGLDQIIGECGPVSLLKIDAEGSEYPILYTSRRIGEVSEIVGEAHRVDGEPGQLVADLPVSTFNMESLRSFLEVSGWQVTTQRESQEDDTNTIFWCVKEKPSLRGLVVQITRAIIATAGALPANTFNNGAGTITMNANGALAIDGQTPTAGDVVLVKDEAPTHNGIYTVTQVGDGSNPGILARDGGGLTNGVLVMVILGDTNKLSGWLLTTTGAISYGTTDIEFAKVIDGRQYLCAC